MIPRASCGLFLAVILLSSLALAQSNNAITTGEFIVEPATIHNLGFEWKISGDDKRSPSNLPVA